MTKILDIKNVEMKFPGCHALQGVDMTIEPGQIVGLLGPNASGKTTLLKIIAGLLQPAAGSVQYGADITEACPEARKLIGFCPDYMKFPRWMRVKDVFAFYKDMYPDYSQARAEELMGLLELNPVLTSSAKSLSKGMHERLALAATFSRETSLYLLDEPLDGIDPVGKTKVIDTIISMQPDGASTLISTHLVKDIERILTNVYFLSKGKIVFSGDCDTIREERNKTIEQAYLEVFINEGSY
ncbi:MAG: ABC transporter ATP-binding protein [Oscillospiraceae bacterium]|nr:ABC transporter ATP-binding protein [Oscillospiraceae bacterium]